MTHLDVVMIAIYVPIGVLLLGLGVAWLIGLIR